MFKTVFTLILLALTSLNVNAATITATHDYSYSGLLTDPVIVNLDFGMSGSMIGDVTIDLAFEDNLWDAGDSITFFFHVNALNPIYPNELAPFTIIYTNETNISFDSFNSNQATEDKLALVPPEYLYLYEDWEFIRGLYIDNDGYASFEISSDFVSNGVNITDMSITAELTAVPLPGALLLFISGLGFLTFNASRK